MTTAPAPVADPAHAGTAHLGGKGLEWPFPLIFLAPPSYGVEPTWTRRPTIAVDKPNVPVSPHLQPCLDWLNSSHGIAWTVKLLAQYKLNDDAEEVANDVACKVWMRLSRRPDTKIDNIEGYCYRALRNHIVDLLGGAKHMDFEKIENDDRDEPAPKILENLNARARTPEDDIETDDRIRAYVESSGKKPKVVSAALAYLVLTRFDDIDCSDLDKAPDGGATPDQARWWPCLWLAEHDVTMFPPPKNETSAKVAGVQPTKQEGARQRQRLRHAKNRALNLLAMGHHHVRGAQ